MGGGPGGSGAEAGRAEGAGELRVLRGGEPGHELGVREGAGVGEDEQRAVESADVLGVI